MEQHSNDESQHKNNPTGIKKPGKGPITALVIVIVLAIVSIGGTWYYMNNQAKNDKKAQDAQIQQLQKQVDELKKQGATKTDKPTITTTTTTKTVDEVVAQIVKDVPAKNYAGLSDYMADTVKVVIAASEYQPSVTKAQAIVDMKYLNGGVSPWDFDPTAAELNSYKTGDYKTYLNSAGIFGVASNGYFVAFTLNGSNQISQIFMAVDAELIN